MSSCSPMFAICQLQDYICKYFQTIYTTFKIINLTVFYMTIKYFLCIYVCKVLKEMLNIRDETLEFQPPLVLGEHHSIDENVTFA